MPRYSLLFLLVLGVILGSGYAVHRWGYERGCREVQEEWGRRERALVTRVEELERAHLRAQEELVHEAERLRADHEGALAAQRAVYEQRLSRSSRRAEVYRSQAKAGASSARDLADHAARLDRALEEGIGLVRELRAALGLREDQLRLLGEQLLRDRRLASEELE